MKLLPWLAASLALGLVHETLLPAASAQSHGPGIAIIDLTYIFENHGRFKAMRENMQRDVKRAEDELNLRKDELTKLAEQLNEFRPGSPNFKSIEEELAGRQADLNVKVKLQQKEFLQQEAKIYYTVYQEIIQEVGYYAKQHGINLVLRFNGDPVEVDEPQSVLKALNNPIVYHDRIDITPFILDQLNRRQAANPDAGRQGVPGPPPRR